LREASGDVTALLRRWCQGDEAAGAELTPLVYSELRRLAKQRLRRERAEHSWQSGDLVHEAYLRLVAQGDARWNDRAHFFAACAQMMRRILVDHARSRHREKRGGGAATLVLNEALDLPHNRPYELIALDDALTALARLDPQQSRIVELRFFTGLSIDETAEALRISKATANRHWVTARAWLIRELSRE
jgi:RNA polymerase sigma factor (TIGR02999 family)